LIDSQLWKRWLWPEFEVLHFNTVQNKSHEWGISPWYWYFLNALPKSLTVALPLVGLGVFMHERRTLNFSLIKLIAPALVFVGLYSFLPHKEL